MKKKLVSVLLSTVMVAGVFSGLGISASAAENEIICSSVLRSMQTRLMN